MVELLVTFAVLGFMTAALCSFYLAGLLSWQRGLQRVEAQQNARIALDTILNDLQGADWVELHLPGEEESYSEVHFTTPGEERTLRYCLRGGNLVKNSVPQGSYHLTAALDLQSLQFRSGDDGVIAVTLQARSGTQSVIMSGAVAPRNTGRGESFQ